MGKGTTFTVTFPIEPKVPDANSGNYLAEDKN
jgi:hypothetical protein